MALDLCTYLAFPRVTEPINFSHNSCQVLYSGCSAINGFRYQKFVTNETNITSWYFDYDFYTSGYIPNYLFVARADLLASLSSIQILNSPDNVTYTVRATIAAPLTLTGNDDNDFFYTNVALPAARYWRVKLNYSTGVRVKFSKILFGQLFDFTKNFSSQLIEQTEFETRPEYISGANYIYQSRRSKPTRSYDIKYVMLSDAVIGSFIDNVIYKEKRFCVLAKLGGTNLTNNQDTTHGIISAIDIVKKDYDNSDLKFTITEMHG